MPCGHLWLWRLDVPHDELTALHGLLSEEERARAGRFLAARHRDRFIAAHGVLRRLLGGELRRAPESLQFEVGAHGKPRLAGADAGSGLEFNLSHSGDQALLGCAWRHELGVDIEQWREMQDEAALVQRYFSPAEQAAYAAMPPARRSRGFFQCWTRKEAYVKAVGRGLGLPLDSFDVSLDDGEGARLLRCSPLGGKELPWCLSVPDVGAQISAAVVLAAERCSLLVADET